MFRVKNGTIIPNVVSDGVGLGDVNTEFHAEIFGRASAFMLKIVRPPSPSDRSCMSSEFGYNPNSDRLLPHSGMEGGLAGRLYGLSESAVRFPLHVSVLRVV